MLAVNSAATLDVILAACLSALLAGTGWYLRGLRSELRANNRHVNAVMFSLWNLVWRVDALEDDAKADHDFVPPRAMPEWPFKE